MKYFKDVSGEIRPASQITSIRRGKWTGGNFPQREDGRVFLADESIVTVDDDEIDRLMRGQDPVVAALPGFAVLGYYSDATKPEDPPYIEVEPVVAWRIDDENQATPVVSDPTFEGMTGLNAIWRPNLTVVDLFGSVYENRSAWEDAMKVKMEEERARAKATAPAPSPRT